MGALGSYFRLPVNCEVGQLIITGLLFRAGCMGPCRYSRSQRAAAERTALRNVLGRGRGWAGRSIVMAGAVVGCARSRASPIPERCFRWNPDELIYELPREEDW